MDEDTDQGVPVPEDEAPASDGADVPAEAELPAQAEEHAGADPLPDPQPLAQGEPVLLDMTEQTAPATDEPREGVEVPADGEWHELTVTAPLSEMPTGITATIATPSVYAGPWLTLRFHATASTETPVLAEGRYWHDRSEHVVPPDVAERLLAQPGFVNLGPAGAPPAQGG